MFIVSGKTTSAQKIPAVVWHPIISTVVEQTGVELSQSMFSHQGSQGAVGWVIHPVIIQIQLKVRIHTVSVHLDQLVTTRLQVVTKEIIHPFTHTDFSHIQYHFSHLDRGIMFQDCLMHLHLIEMSITISSAAGLEPWLVMIEHNLFFTFYTGHPVVFVFVCQCLTKLFPSNFFLFAVAVSPSAVACLLVLVNFITRFCRIGAPLNSMAWYSLLISRPWSIYH